MDIRHQTCALQYSPEDLGNAGVQSNYFDFDKFDRPISRLTVGLSQIASRFANNHDHHFGELTIRAVPYFQNNIARVAFLLGLRDFSKEWDDPFSGEITATALAQYMTAQETSQCTNLLKINTIKIKQQEGFYRNWREFDPLLPLRAHHITLVRIKATYNYDDIKSRFTQLTGMLIYDGQQFDSEQFLFTRIYGFSPTGSMELEFKLEPYVCNNLLSVRFQLKALQRRREPALNSFITGTVFNFI